MTMFKKKIARISHCLTLFEVIELFTCTCFYLQVFTSPELRNHVLSPPYLPTSSCECFACASCEEDPQEDAAALQMVVLQNGGVNL